MTFEEEIPTNEQEVFECIRGKASEQYLCVNTYEG